MSTSEVTGCLHGPFSVAVIDVTEAPNEFGPDVAAEVCSWLRQHTPQDGKQRAVVAIHGPIRAYNWQAFELALGSTADANCVVLVANGDPAKPPEDAFPVRIGGEWVRWQELGQVAGDLKGKLLVCAVCDRAIEIAAWAETGVHLPVLCVVAPTEVLRARDAINLVPQFLQPVTKAPVIDIPMVKSALSLARGKLQLVFPVST